MKTQTKIHLPAYDTCLEVDNYNNDFLLLKSANSQNSQEDLRMIGKAMFERKWDFVEEVIVTEVEICLQLNHRFQPKYIAQISEIASIAAEETTCHELPIYFSDTADWQAVEQHTGLSKTAIIAHLEATIFSIAMFAFLPGFLYLDGLPENLYIPRKAIPAKYIPANSLAIGGKYLGIYSLPSPGGWHVIGQLATPILQIPELPPVRFNLGDRVRLKACNKDFNR